MLPRNAQPISKETKSPQTLPRILIVEDDNEYAIQLKRALLESNEIAPSVKFEVEIVSDVSAARKHVQADDVDVYFVDLRFKTAMGEESAEPGLALVREIGTKINAGLIVHSTLPADSQAAQLLSESADDYIEKMSRHGDYAPNYDQRPIYKMIRAKAVAVWRRVQLVRPAIANKYAHSGRVFKVGDWRFTVSSRDLEDYSGKHLRITPTQHAFLRFLCTVEEHEIDRETFNLVILGRPEIEKDKRMDDFIYRFKNKVGPSVQIVSRRDTSYKLVSVEELRRRAK